MSNQSTGLRTAVFCGPCAMHSFLINEDCQLSAIGSNVKGQLGLGDTDDRNEPAVVDFFRGEEIIHIAVGQSHSLFILKGGEMYGAGLNSYGELGVSDISETHIPIVSNFFSEHSLRVKQAACGNMNSIVLTEDGSVYILGWAEERFLVGNGPIPDPEKKEFPVGSKISYVSCGWMNFVALNADGELFSWGESSVGKIGRHGKPWTPLPVDFITAIGMRRKVRIHSVICGYSFTLAITSEGYVVGWGFNNDSQMGHKGGMGMIETTPFAVGFIEDLNRSWMRAGGSHTYEYSLARNGKMVLSSRGSNSFGQLDLAGDSLEKILAGMSPPHGRGANRCISFGQATGVVNSKSKRCKIVDVACGIYHTIAILSNGDCFLSGRVNNLEPLAEPPRLIFRNVKFLASPRFWAHRLLEYAFEEQVREVELRMTDQVLHLINTKTGIEEKIHVNRQLTALRLGNGRAARRIAKGKRMEYIACLKSSNEDEEVPMIAAITNVKLEDGEEMKKWFIEMLYCSEMFPTKYFAPVTAESSANAFDVAFASESENLDTLPRLSRCMDELFNAKEQDGDIKIMSYTSPPLSASSESQSDSICAKEASSCGHCAHKFVLVARREYFRAMFQGHWEESVSSVVMLEMELGEPFEAYLRYLYTGNLDVTPEMANSMLKYVEYFDEGSEEDSWLKKNLSRITG